MPRTSKGPRYYDSKNGWFANINGERIRLTTGPKKATEQEAKAKYDDAMQVARVQTDGDRGPVWAVLYAWLDWLKNRVDPPPVQDSTYDIAKRYVDLFCKMFGDVATRDIRLHHFDEWLTAMMDEKRRHTKTGWKLSWGPGGRRLAIRNLRAAFAWATTAGDLIKVNPFKVAGAEKLRPKRVNYKGKKTPIKDDEHRLLVEYALGRQHKDFAYLLMFLYGTGARPAEIHQATAQQWNEELKVFVIPAGEANDGQYKLARFGNKRTIFIPRYLWPLARVLVEKYPSGPIFRNERGRPWNVRTIARRFDSHADVLNKRAGEVVVRDEVTAYSYRHSYVTRWMENPQADIKHLAELLNTSVTQIERTYSHLFEKHATLRESLERFEAAQRGSAPPAPSGAVQAGS